MTLQQLIARLESLDFLFVTVVEEEQNGDAALTAVDPQGYQLEIEMVADLVVDRKIGAKNWDIMFIGEESYL